VGNKFFSFLVHCIFSSSSKQSFTCYTWRRHRLGVWKQLWLWSGTFC